MGGTKYDAKEKTMVRQSIYIREQLKVAVATSRASSLAVPWQECAPILSWPGEKQRTCRRALLEKLELKGDVSARVPQVA